MTAAKDKKKLAKLRVTTRMSCLMNHRESSNSSYTVTFMWMMISASTQTLMTEQKPRTHQDLTVHAMACEVLATQTNSITLLELSNPHLVTCTVQAVQ